MTLSGCASTAMIALALIGSHFSAPPAAAQAAGEAQPAFTREDAQKNLAIMRRIVTPNGIETLEAVEIGGIKQWISVRGTDKRNPILLLIHGGPGYPFMPTIWHSTRGWEDYFTVVQWDQRGSGKTYAANDAKQVVPTMTMARMIADAGEVIALLRTRYQKQKLFVAGHSWGSLVGLEIARSRPEWLHAYIGMGQGIDVRESERRGWRFAMEQAKATGNREAIVSLQAVAPAFDGGRPLTLKALFTQRPWLEVYGGSVYRRKGYEAEAAAVRLSPDYAAEDRAAFNVSGEYALTQLLPEILEVDYSKLDRIDCPVIIFNGRHDYNSSQSVAAEWFERLKAPSKSLIWFENSAHMMINEEPGKTLVELVRNARPFAERAGDAPAK